MKKLLAAFLMTGSLFLTSLSAIEEITEPYCSINNLPFDPHGWFGNAEQLAACFKEKPITTVIEIGSWLGSSTRFLATSVANGGKVYAVDTWAGSPGEPVHMQDPRLPYLYQLFLSNVKHAQLTGKIVPVRMNSLEASKALNVKADLIYIDGAHDTTSVYLDILHWHSHLNEGGIMCGDDWLWPTVQAAVVKSARQLNKSIYVSHNFWRFY
jgi:predicted O-methyltransferase YrrM